MLGLTGVFHSETPPALPTPFFSILKTNRQLQGVAEAHMCEVLHHEQGSPENSTQCNRYLERGTPQGCVAPVLVLVR